MPFNYKKQSQYSQEDMDAILADHAKFKDTQLKDYVPRAEHEKATSELNTFKVQQKQNEVFKSMEGKVRPDAYKAAYNLSKITSEMTEDEVNKALEATLQENPFLKHEEPSTSGDEVVESSNTPETPSDSKVDKPVWAEHSGL